MDSNHSLRDVYNNSNACIVHTKSNVTIIIQADLYEGIPQTFVLSLIAWIVLMFLFCLLRYHAWDYGGSGSRKKWTQLFYAHGSDEIQYNEPTSLDGTQSNRSSYVRQSSSRSTNSTEKKFFTWIKATIKLTDEQILRHCGPDALHYLSFQRHLIVVLAIITLVSICIILPINFQGLLVKDTTSFAHTTISNLEPTSSLLWIHTIVAITFVPLVVLIMRRSSGRNAGKVAPTKTIMITNITNQDCNVNTIQTYLEEIFQNIGITDVQLAYDVSKLTSVSEDYNRVNSARIYCEIYQNRGTTIKAYPKCCSIRSKDALEYYRDEELKLCGEVARLKAAALNNPLGIAFVTFASAQAAQNVIQQFRPGTYRNWSISFAPSATDIYWENLNVGTSQWWCKWATINIGLFLFLFFLTTPILIVNIVNSWMALGGNGALGPIISEFLPPLLLIILTVVMPVIVAYSDKLLAHWTLSKQNYSIMTKTFGYLLFMILILPSLGLTSAQAFLDWTFHYQDDGAYRWECIFLPDKGAFYVNYLISIAFIATAMELIRVPDLLYYMWMLCLAKSPAETPYIRKTVLEVFPFGVHYSWQILVFTIAVVYSLACPLIMPFAMIYICIKHFNDRHNLYFAYRYSNMISQGGGKIHSTAVTMTKYSVVFLLVVMASLASLRSAEFDARAVVLIMSLCITLLLFAFMSPIKKCTTKPPRIIETDYKEPAYIPDVLLRKIKCIENQSNRPNNYGTNQTEQDVVMEVEPNELHFKTKSDLL